MNVWQSCAVLSGSLALWTTLSVPGLAQAKYGKEYFWVQGKAVASLGAQRDEKGFLEVNQTGVHYGIHEVKKTGPAPQVAKFSFRSLAKTSASSQQGFCWSEAMHDTLDAIGGVGGGIAAQCEFVNLSRGTFVALSDADDTTFDYELKCDVDPLALDHGTTLSVRFGVTNFRHGLKVIFDKFDQEWDLYAWFLRPGGYTWFRVPHSVSTLNLDLTMYGGPIGFGQLAHTENTIDFGCTGVNFGQVQDGDFRASVRAR